MTPAVETPVACLSNGIPIRNVWYMLLYAWDDTPQSRYWTLGDAERAPSLDALLARLLHHTMTQRLRIGLGRNYVPQQTELRGVRGRIQFSQSVKQQSFARGRAICRYEQYSPNAPRNQIIRTTLHRLAQLGDFGPQPRATEALRHDLRQLVRTLDGVDLIELSPVAIDRARQGHHDRDYHIMLNICALVLARQMPVEQAGTAVQTQLDRDRLTLFRVFEKFVANFYRHHLTGWHITPQKQLAWHATTATPYLPLMRPDLVLRSATRHIVLDTKFTAHSLTTNQHGKQLLDSAHLYQMQAYLSTQAHLSDTLRHATGILLYPTAGVDLSERIQLHDHQIWTETVNLATDWSQIEQRLLALVAEVGA